MDYIFISMEVLIAAGQVLRPTNIKPEWNNRC